MSIYSRMGKGYKKIEPSDNPKPFKKGEVANPDGRPKKIYTIIKEMGYSADDMKAVFSELSWYTTADLKKIYENESSPHIVRIVANQLYLALAKGDMYKVKEIIEYTLGRPSQSIDVKTDMPPLPIVNIYTSHIPMASNENDVDE